MATVNLGAIRFNWKGAYNNGTAYVVDDVVSSAGNSYICILASTGNAVSNATYWSIMSSAGTDGTDLTSTITTQGDVLYRDGSGLQRLAKGTAAQVLSMNAGATAPEWAAAGGGAWDVKQSGGAATNISSFEYTAVGTKDIWIRMNGLTSTGSGMYLDMQVSQGSGFITSGTGYNHAQLYFEGGDALVTNHVQNNNYFRLTTVARMPATGGDSVRSFCTDIHIFDPGGTTRHTLVYSKCYLTNDGKGIIDWALNSFDTNTSAIDGFKLFASSANFNYDSYAIMELN